MKRYITLIKNKIICEFDLQEFTFELLQSFIESGFKIYEYSNTKRHK